MSQLDAMSHPENGGHPEDSGGGLHIAVIDIGKTNAKLALVDSRDLSEIVVVTRPNRVLPGPPWPHFDTEGHWDFLLGALADFHRLHRVDRIAVTTHGASGVLLDAAGGLAAPVLDYEHRGPDDLAAAYDAIRPDFALTGSPRLGGGLNLGAQLFWQFRTDPGLRARCAAVLTYPQYWSYLLTGVAACDSTSLGCHTDLWEPYQGRFSPLVARLGLEGKMAPLRAPGEVLGPILPAIAARTGLAPDTPVVCGIHDSNASLVPHLRARQAPFSVVSSGTWVVVMAVGGTPVALDAARDVLVNVNALGQPVPSARFMGGREFEIIAAGQAGPVAQGDVTAVLARQIMLLPAVVGDSGPFQGRTAHWTPEEPAVGSGLRSAALGYYLALMTAQCLELVGHRGEVVVEGPFARNPQYCEMLAVAAQSPVLRMQGATGTSQGAALLACPVGRAGDGAAAQRCLPQNDASLADYARLWRQRAG